MRKKIVLDCLGGDEGINGMLEGALLALKKDNSLKMVLVGDEKVIKPKVGVFGDRVEVINTTENISVDEHPTEAIKKRLNSSMVLGLTELKSKEDCGAFLSAGSTGALLTGGVLKIGRIPGVSRPAMCPELPTALDGKNFMLIDCGANMDSSAVNLVHFAVMANEYLKAMNEKVVCTEPDTGSVNNNSETQQLPKVALLNVGSEDTKGNEVVKQTFEILSKLSKEKLINFVGNIEADQVFKGEADVVVADGFSGNVLLKGIEGTVKFLFKQIKNIMTNGLGAKIGALFLGKKLKKFKNEKMKAQAGSIFLGLRKPVIKMHGNSKPETVASAIEYACTVANIDLSDKIEKALSVTEKFLAVNEKA